jgi:transcriptional regulator with XRE-family HTH domain
MQERKMGVRAAAEQAGVAPSVIVSWRSGAYPEDFVAVKRLAKALGVSMSFILTGEEDNGGADHPTVTQVFDSDGILFDGFAKITIERLLPRRVVDPALNPKG